METLIAEDLLLLLLDDEKGTMTSGGAAQPLLGGALLVELALGGHVAVQEQTSRWRTARVAATGTTPPPTDPVLVSALAVVADKPRTAQDLVQRIGKGVREELQERLVGRGVLERREGRVLGLFPRTTWPAADVAHEQRVRQRLHGVLVTGLAPDPGSAALVSLLVAVDQAHQVVDRDGLSAGELRRRAKQVGKGDWAAAAVRDAVQATQAAITAGVMAAAAAATSGSS